MRWMPLPVCALMLLSGCGQNAAETPKLAILPNKDSSTSSEPKTNAVPQAKNDGVVAKKVGPEVVVKKEEAPQPNLGAFDPEDAEKTLHWLVANLAKVRGVPAGDEAAVKQAWEAYNRTIQPAGKQKLQIRWVLSVDSLVRKDGVVLQTVKSADDSLCHGLRVKPSVQPTPSFESFVLEIPTASRANLSSGAKVVLTGAVELIETHPRTAHTANVPYWFHIRVSDHAVAPLK
jgi:hypothetical protein